MQTPEPDQEANDDDLPQVNDPEDIDAPDPEAEVAKSRIDVNGRAEHGLSWMREHLGPIAGSLAVAAAIAGLASQEAPKVVGAVNVAEATARPPLAKLPKLNPLDLPTVVEARSDLKLAGFRKPPKIVPAKSNGTYPVARPGDEFVATGWAQKTVSHVNRKGKSVQVISYTRLQPRLLPANKQIYMRVKEVSIPVEAAPDLTTPVDGIPKEVLPSNPNPGGAPHPDLGPAPPTNPAPPEVQPPTGEPAGLHNFELASGYNEIFNPVMESNLVKPTVEVLRKLKGNDANGNPHLYVKWVTGTMTRLRDPNTGVYVKGVESVAHGLKEETGDLDGDIPSSVLPDPADFGPKSNYDYIAAIPGAQGEPLQVIAALPHLLVGPESDDSFLVAAPIATAPSALDNFPFVDWKQTTPPRPGSPGRGYAMPETTSYAPIMSPNRYIGRIVFMGGRKFDLVGYQAITPSPTDPGGSGGQAMFNNGSRSGPASVRGATGSPLAFDNATFYTELKGCAADQLNIIIDPHKFPSIEGYSVNDSLPSLLAGLSNPAP